MASRNNTQAKHSNSALHLTWKPLQYLNIYRLLLALLVITLNFAGITPSPLGSHNFELLHYSALFYLFFSILSIFTIQNNWPEFSIQLYIQILTDIVIITLMMHASGGAGSGIGALLIVTVAGSSLLSGGRTAAFFAATASLAVLLEQFYNVLEDNALTTSHTQAGLLGATFFATALLGYTLAKRLRDSEALAEKRGVDLANMAQLTEYIIQRMQTGIIVLDNDKSVRLINESARHLLEIDNSRKNLTLNEISPTLEDHLSQWHKNDNNITPMFRASASSAEIMPRFASLGDREKPGTMIFIEDMAAMAQQAQQLKLASLGRLTASIAHEIRNPLGAISHAGQLLAETDQLNEADQRLTEIIQTNSKRVNTIIENIMQLSRRQQTQSEELQLGPWLKSFCHDFGNDNIDIADNINMSITPDNILVRFDSSQLRQVISNLCQNAMHHGNKTDLIRLSLRAGISNDSHKPFLDIVDNGSGVASNDINKLFEPFFTTSGNGTGLGLYLARELCESNQARLDYIPTDIQGACFRITFADSRRQQVL